MVAIAITAYGNAARRCCGLPTIKSASREGTWCWAPGIDMKIILMASSQRTLQTITILARFPMRALACTHMADMYSW